MAAALLGLAACTTPHPGPRSDHFDGTRFFNPGHAKTSSPAGYAWLRLTTTPAAWPDAVPLPAAAPPPVRVADGTARVTFVGHATLLIQVAGLNILADPVWSERASPVGFAGPKRVTAPGVAFDALPPVDLVLISHNHYDHLDLATLARLDARHRPRVLVPLGNAAAVQAAMPASTVSEHDWGAVVAVGALRVTFEPMLHGSGRTLFDQQRTLWAAFVLEAAGLKLLHVGDSAYGDGRLWRDLAARHGGFDLAMLPIGAYEPRSFMADSHMNPAEAVKARAALRARTALAHHFEAFPLGFEAFEAPRQALAEAMQAAGLPEGVFIAPRPGQALVVRPD